jgi:hypothetical protein
MHSFAALCHRLAFQQSPLATFPDVGNTGSPYHTGVMFASRVASKKLLDQWANVIISGQFHGDQVTRVVTLCEVSLRFINNLFLGCISINCKCNEFNK